MGERPMEAGDEEYSAEGDEKELLMLRTISGVDKDTETMGHHPVGGKGKDLGEFVDIREVREKRKEEEDDEGNKSLLLPTSPHNWYNQGWFWETFFKEIQMQLSNPSIQKVAI